PPDKRPLPSRHHLRPVPPGPGEGLVHEVPGILPRHPIPVQVVDDPPLLLKIDLLERLDPHAYSSHGRCMGIITCVSPSSSVERNTTGAAFPVTLSRTPPGISGRCSSRYRRFSPTLPASPLTTAA